ncbi:DNA polymerase III subunit beta [Helicobacter labacensis]|uniref:DNA polymerase III subunit beta n=1 Tax=Helicobacter labacensis TaxID=2316079 RepID=UPI000EB4C93E|nr:DNA polymerase III subunit beta [Helicobacter labacensis]
MKFSIAKIQLESALKGLMPFTDKKDPSNISAHICIEATPKSLILQANDLEMGLCLTLNIDTQEGGSAVLNAKHLLDILSKLELGDLTLESQGDFVLVSFKRSKFKLPVLDKAYFPEFPPYAHLPSVRFSDTSLGDYFKKLAPVISTSTTNSPKYEFTGALLVLQEHLELVATDTRRLSRAQMQLEESPSDHGEFILPKRAMLEITKLFSSDFEMFYDPKNPTMLFFKNASTVLFAKLISGKYPSYQSVIPTQFTHTMELNTQDFKDAINITHALGATTKIIFHPDKIEFETLESESPSFASTFIEASTPLDQHIIHAQARYLLDALNALPSPTFELCLNEQSAPFVIQKNDFLTVVMPITQE